MQGGQDWDGSAAGEAARALKQTPFRDVAHCLAPLHAHKNPLQGYHVATFTTWLFQSHNTTTHAGLFIKKIYKFIAQLQKKFRRS